MIPSSSHNRTGNGSSGFSYKWLAMTETQQAMT